MTANDFNTLHERVRRVARDVAAPHAGEVDQQARFPAQTLQALRESKVLSAGVPAELGGAGCNLTQMATLCATLSQACSASGMVLAMHLIQVGCLVRHGLGTAFFRDYLRDLVREQWLLGSVTSEVGTFGDTRSSICAVQRDGQRFALRKAATTVSYGLQSDALLITARRDAQAAASDQVLVLLHKGQYTLSLDTAWDTLGMRGTCSPGGIVQGEAGLEQILPGDYAQSSAQTMVPYSHGLWSALWWGIAADAVSRAAGFVRAQARKTPGTVPPTALLLADASGQLQVMRSHWSSVCADFDAVGDGAAGREALTELGWALRLNSLKITSAELAPAVVHKVLQIVGILGYKNDTPFSVGRHYRDVLSASLMVSNERIAAKNASMLLVFKDE